MKPLGELYKPAQAPSVTKGGALVSKSPFGKKNRDRAASGAKPDVGPGGAVGPVGPVGLGESVEYVEIL
jgi:hypothetical protein